MYIDKLFQYLNRAGSPTDLAKNSFKQEKIPWAKEQMCKMKYLINCSGSSISPPESALNVEFSIRQILL